jgi:hypothetical protein
VSGLLWWAFVMMLAALVAAYAELVRALWLRYGSAVHAAVWRAFIAIGSASDRLDAEIDAAAAARRRNG